MAATLANVATADTYGVAPTVSLTGAVKSQVTVSNAAVHMRVTSRDVDGTTTIGPDVFLLPGFYSLVRPLNKLEFKSAVAGVPGRVSAELLLGSESG